MSDQQVVRLLRHHGRAFKAELASQWARADFYWREAQMELQVIDARQGAWEAVAKALGEGPGVEVMADPAQLRRRRLS